MANQYKNKVIFNGVTLIDLSDTTAVQSDVASGKSFYTASGQKVLGTGSGGGSTPSATKHTIHFDFSDETDTDIDVYYDDTLLATMIQDYTPATYGQKTVILAQLDGVTWYSYDPSETWETLWDGDVNWLKEDNGNYPYCWISSLGSTPITVGSVFRVTYDNTEYRCTAKTASLGGRIYNVFGNPIWGGGADDGSGVPFLFIDYTMYSAWSGGLDVPNINNVYYFKIERLVTA